jgi:hypothetical protein
VLHTHQVEALRNASEDEAARRRLLEATLAEAAALFRRELRDKASEVAGLQGTVRDMRTQLTATSTNTTLAAAAAHSPGRTLHMTATTAAGSPGMGGTAGGGYTTGCVGSPGVGECGSPVAAAAAGLQQELAALRGTRVQYAAALAESEAVRNELLGTLGDTLRVRGRDRGEGQDAVNWEVWHGFMWVDLLRMGKGEGEEWGMNRWVEGRGGGMQVSGWRWHTRGGDGSGCLR